jgi:hypothetical protein
VGKAEFEANLRDNGYAQALSKDGKADILTKEDRRFTARDESNAGYVTAEYFPGTQSASIKIRLVGK